MKTKHGVFIGFAVIALAAIFTLAGCDNGENRSNLFVGTWSGVDNYGQTMNLSITSTA
jgi:uncharacterized lipoprotein YehR (DUF1307 family)